MAKIVRNIKRVLLVEAAGSHDECLYTQMNALKDAGVDFHLGLDESVSSRFVCEESKVTVIRRAADAHRTIVRNIAALISTYQPDIVVFNTAQGRIVRDLSIKFLFRKVKFVGLIHTTRKFKGSFTQRLINLKIRDYLFLAEFLLKDVGVKSGFNMDYFYPLDLPGDIEASPNMETKKIVLVGGVEDRRKDLKGLIEMIRQEELKAYRWVFLGKSDPTKAEVENFIQEIEQADLRDKIKLYNSFVSHEEFMAELRDASFILPLVHPGTPSSDQYFRNQIPGAMTISFALKIPMFVHEEYRSIAELESASFYYTTENFGKQLEGISLEDYSAKISKMRSLEQFSANAQREKFMRFLVG